MKDIAMLAGVSRQVVSTVLNGNGSSRVSPVKKEAILKLACDLNYVPNTVARTLAGSHTKAIGLLASMVPGWNNHLAGEICSLLTSHGYNTLTSHYGHCSAEASLIELVSRGVDGVVVLNSDSRSELERNLTVPHVFGSNNNLGGYDVGICRWKTGYIGTEHLLEHGHKQVVFLGIHTDDRERGWRDAHAAHGIKVDDRQIICLRELDGRVDKVLARLQELKATAIFAQNDYLAARAVRLLTDRGMRIPDDIAIVGCDGYTFTEFCPVPLSTVIQPLRPQAEAIVNLLLDRIERKELGAGFAGITVEPIIWRNASCGCPRREIETFYRLNTFGSLEKDMRMNDNINITEDI